MLILIDINEFHENLYLILLYISQNVKPIIFYYSYHILNVNMGFILVFALKINQVVTCPT